MKVLQVIDTLEAGGAERLAVAYGNGLVEHVTASFLCATRAEGPLKASISKNVGYEFVQRKKTFDLKAILRLKRFIKQHRIEIVHAHATSFFIVFLVKLIYPKFKLVWHDHYGNSEHLHKRKVWPIKIASLSFSGIIAVNEILRSWSQKKLFAKKVIYLSNFATKNENEVAETFLEGKGGKRIVSLANLRPQKDHLNLLSAFLEIQKSTDDWSLHIVGKDFEDVYAASVKSYVNEHRLENSVFLYGSRNDIGHILGQCEIGVLSSNSEGLPISLLEYGLANLAVVSTDVGDCKKVIANEENGSVVPPSNAQKLSEALLELINDPSKRSKLARNFNEHIEKQYSKEHILEELINFYRII